VEKIQRENSEQERESLKGKKQQMVAEKKNSSIGNESYPYDGADEIQGSKTPAPGKTPKGNQLKSKQREINPFALGDRDPSKDLHRSGKIGKERAGAAVT